jgi:vancomycin aglycone glucosyltransferase
VKIVIAPVGTRGDVQPMLALAVALLARGHQVTMCVPDVFRALAEATGARVLPGGGNPQEMMRDKGEGIKNPLTFLALARTEVQKQFTYLDDACAGGVDVIVGTMLLAAGQTVAAQRGARYVVAAYFAQVLPTREVWPMMFGHPRMPRALWPLGWRAYLGFSDAALLALVNREREGRGLARTPSLFAPAIMATGTILCAFDEQLMRAPSDWGGRYRHEVTGFWFYDHNAPALSPELRAFLDAGAPPVFIGFGSMPTDDAARTTSQIGAALAFTGERAVVAAGCGGIGAGLASERVFVVDGAVDHRALFPRCSAIVHHGGAGTTAQAARAGVPQVLVPHMFDQHHWAARVTELGVGVGASLSTLAKALARVRSDDVCARARELASALVTDGVGRASEIIERG